MRTKVWFIFLIALLLAAGCSSGNRSVSLVTADSVIIYQRTGGFAGVTQEWIIHPDGRVEAPGEQELRVDPEDTATLFSLAASNEIADLQDSYIPEDDCCDKFIYTVIIKNGDLERPSKAVTMWTNPRH